ncbi:MAG: hypothetical protein ACI4KF_04005 [Huintestinicola sp.]
MSVRFDLTAIAFELTDAVIHMDGSPAYAAFKEEIEAILSDFNSKGHLSSSWTVDEKDLTAKSEDTMKNMHRAFLIWSYNEELKGQGGEASVGTYIKLFFKSQLDTLIALNGGSKFVEASKAAELIAAYKKRVTEDPAVFDSAKNFFKGYVYGYFFNYISEQKIMKKYAEMIAYLGVMSNKIPTSISEQQKILPKMAPLLANDRFKYINGCVPRELMLTIVFNRLELSALPANEAELMKTRIKEYILKTYRTETEDEIPLIADNVTVSLMTDLFSSYINVPEFSTGIYNKSFAGVRTFLDSDRDDTGEFDAAKVSDIVSAKCAAGFNPYYSCNREANIDLGLEGDEKCFKYPIICADENDFYFAPLYEEVIYPYADKEIYDEIPASGIKTGTYPFIDEALKTNCIKTIGGLTGGTITVRKDKLNNLSAYNAYLDDSSMSERDRKMLALEQMLVVLSGNCSAEKYKQLLDANLFGSGLYEEYIRYRLDHIIKKGTTDRSTKKNLLDIVNNITI